MTKQKIKSFIKWTLGLVLLGFVALVCFILSVIWGLWEPLPSEQQLLNIKQSEATEILDRNNELIGKYFRFDRQPITYEQIPKHLIDALIATEDIRFFEHNGIDKRSLLRVAFKSILLGDDSSGGGSTISQQLIKNLYSRKNHGIFTMPVNKTKEAYLATKIETLYSKEEIITLYFNTVPFGDNTYGVESASEKFFSVQTSELSLSQSAVIVGMLKASYLYNPRLFPERSKNRRNTVLRQMEKYGFLQEPESLTSREEPLTIDYKPYSYNKGTAPYFRAQLQKYLEKWLTEYNEANGTTFDLYSSGLQIETTIDFKMQQIAETAMAKHMKALQGAFEKSYGQSAPWITNQTLIENLVKNQPIYTQLNKQGLNHNSILEAMSQKRNMELWDWNGKTMVEASTIDSLQHYLKFLNAGMMSLEPRTGAIRAWVGGINFEHFQYDHVIQAKRQVGSTFKPLVYTAALENGLNPCTYISARTVTYENYDNWTPRNSGDINEENTYAVKTALSKSINTIAVKVLEEAEVKNVIDLARKLGIKTEIPAVPSIALGTPEISLFEMAQAYTAFVNDSKPANPFFIRSIRDKNGRLIASFDPVLETKNVMSEKTRSTMIEMMKSVVNEGTASRLRWKYGLKNDIAGKTGTTQNNKDGWFVALTPQLITVTWVGADHHQIGFKTTAMGQGANSALPIFALYQQGLNGVEKFNKYTRAEFPPATMRVIRILDCETEKKPGFITRVFENIERPKISSLKIDTTLATRKKPSFFKRIGGIFKKKRKKEN